MNRPTEGRTNGWTDGRTCSLIDVRGRNLKKVWKNDQINERNHFLSETSFYCAKYNQKNNFELAKIYHSIAFKIHTWCFYRGFHVYQKICRV